MREKSLGKVTVCWPTGSSMVPSAMSPSLTLSHAQPPREVQLWSVGPEDTDWALCRADTAMSNGGAYGRVWCTECTGNVSIIRRLTVSISIFSKTIFEVDVPTKNTLTGRNVRPRHVI